MSQWQDDVKQRVREASDIVQVIGEYVELRKAGSRFTGLCPFHAEKTPSFSVNPQGQFFHCFGCGESGDVFSFLMKYNRLSFPEALKELARKYHIDLPEPKLSDADRRRIRERELLYRVNEEAAEIFRKYLVDSPAARKARDYLEERGVRPEVAASFRLGYAPDPETAGWTFLVSALQERGLQAEAVERSGLAVRRERGGWYDRFRDRILFPIMDMSGRVVAFGGRILGEGKPKYMNSPESVIFDKSRLLFGLYQHREGIRSRRKAIVVEGNFDLLLLAVHGFDNVVAPLGTALTPHHIRSLRGYCDEVVLLFDGDSAGLKAAMRSIPFFLAEQVDARVALLPEGHDPDTLVREQGAEGVQALVDEAAPLAEFLYDHLSRRHGATLEGKNRTLRELQEVVSACTDPTQRSLMAAHFSQLLGIQPGQFEMGLRRSEKTVRKPEPVQQGTAEVTRKEKQLLDFLVFYPEFLEKLKAAGLEELVTSEAAREILALLDPAGEGAPPTPDRLLSMLPEGSEARRYVTSLLIAGSPVDDVDTGRGAMQMAEELVSWLQHEKRLRESAALQERINAAQQAGDTALLMELLQQKQLLARNG
ncbi:MAG: DNA primase [Desulfobulbaceae bacterium]